MGIHNNTRYTLEDVTTILENNNVFYRVEDKYTWKEDGLTQYEVTIFVNEVSKKGFHDGFEYGENKNPYKNNGMCDEWWLYEKGYEEGVAEYCRKLESEVE